MYLNLRETRKDECEDEETEVMILYGRSRTTSYSLIFLVSVGTTGSIRGMYQISGRFYSSKDSLVEQRCRVESLDWIGRLGICVLVFV